MSVPGAEEYSAMDAAAGAVQQFGYTASFPSLVNVKGEPTYIMVLKDASQIVKMYAMVNVRNYNIVVTANSQDEVMEKYIAAAGLKKNETPEINEEDIKIIELLIEESMRQARLQTGSSILYWVASPCILTS